MSQVGPNSHHKACWNRVAQMGKALNGHRKDQQNFDPVFCNLFQANFTFDCQRSQSIIENYLYPIERSSKSFIELEWIIILNFSPFGQLHKKSFSKGGMQQKQIKKFQPGKGLKQQCPGLTTYLLKDTNFTTCKGLQSPSQLLILDARWIFNILKAELLGIVKQHQNNSLYDTIRRTPYEIQMLEVWMGFIWLIEKQKQLRKKKRQVPTETNLKQRNRQLLFTFREFCF